MKNRFLSLFSVAALMMAACGLMVSCSDSGTDTPVNETPKTESLTLTVQPTTIVADGIEKATFAVIDHEGTVVTSEVTITCTTDGTKLSGATFTTTTAGTYKFQASRGNVSSNIVEVTATAVEEPAAGEYTLSVKPASIIADGVGVATFTVVDEQQADVTAKAEFWCATTEEKLSGNTFSTYNAGTYEFYALVGDVRTNTVSVEATKMEEPADVPTPIRWSEEHAFPASVDDGCEIEVTGIQHNNFQFVIRPGANVVTYRLDVYPLCRLYNSLFNSLCNATEYDKKVEWALVEEAIRGYVFDTSGAGAYTFDSNGGEEREFDWMNSQYDQANVVPDAEYVIVAVGCYDKDGFDQGDISICHLKTTSEPLIGNPEVKINVETGWKKAMVTHSGNEDCKYFYHYMSTEADLMPYIMGYGRKMYRDFMRFTMGDPYDINDGANNWYLRDWGTSADPSVVWMATAIGLDENETPAEDFQSKLFQLESVPDGIVEGTGSIAADLNYTSSSIVWYDFTIDANARTMLHKLYNTSTIEANKNDEAWLATTALDIDQNGGYGISNNNFGYNVDTEEYTGTSYTGRDFQIIQSALDGNGSYESGGSYQFAYILRNAANDISRIYFSEPFNIKERVTDNPSACQSNGTARLTSEGRTSIKFACEYDFENTSTIYFNWYYGDPSTLSREAALKIAMVGDEQPANIWWATEEGYDQYVVAGVDPATTYTIIYVYEDWNGVLGEVQWTSATTDSIEGGNNPQVEILTEMQEDGLHVSFQANDDTTWMKYAVGDKTSYGASLLLNYLGANIGMGSAEANAQYILDTWELWVTGEAGMTTQNTTASVFNALSDKELYVVLCVPFGKQDVQGDMAYLIYDKGQIKTMGDYYEGVTLGVKAPKSYPKIGQPQQRGTVPPMLKRPEPIKWENSIDKMTGGELRMIDMKSYSTHPKVR